MTIDPTRVVALIFDGDDTLWDTMPIYVRAKQRFFILMRQFDFDASEVEEFFEKRDAENVARLGFSRERFTASMLDTYRHFCHKQKISTSPAMERRIRTIAQRIMTARARRMPYAEQVLQKLHQHYKLLLLTKGEHGIQSRRIQASRLAKYFDEIFIVDRKDATAFASLVRKHGLAAPRTFSVGNSVRSDINPALAAGLSAIWIPRNTWSYEDEVPTTTNKIIRAKSIRDVPNIIRSHVGNTC